MDVIKLITAISLNLVITSIYYYNILIEIILLDVLVKYYPAVIVNFYILFKRKNILIVNNITVNGVIDLSKNTYNILFSLILLTNKYSFYKKYLNNKIIYFDLNNNQYKLDLLNNTLNDKKILFNTLKFKI